MAKCNAEGCAHNNHNQYNSDKRVLQARRVGNRTFDGRTNDTYDCYYRAVCRPEEPTTRVIEKITDRETLMEEMTKEVENDG